MFRSLLDARIRDLLTFYEVSRDVSHPGEKGVLREAFLSRLLESVLPPHFGIGSGLIVDRSGRQSLQTDVIIYDRRLLPPLLEHRGHGIYPIDSVLRALEVKSNLNKAGLEQVKKQAWTLHPDNEIGLKITTPGRAGASQYPVVGLYAYDSDLVDIKATGHPLNVFHGTGGVCCVAKKGVFRDSEFRCNCSGDFPVENT